MNSAVFSISTPDYVNNAAVSLDSFARNCSFSVDIFNLTIDDISNKYCNTNIQKFLEKYNSDHNKLRWSLKPILLMYFLVDKQYTNTIYIDNDLYFVNNIDFLIKDIDKGILLTKHNRPLYPSTNNFLNSQFLCNFTDGFFNAGFIGANINGLDALSWWSSMNYWQCTKAKNYGLFDDQKYLDTMALQFHGCINICEHPGCNLATWNSQTITRSFENSRWTINNFYDPIFCHFSGIENQHERLDPMLHDFYKNFVQEVNGYGKQ